MIKKIIQYFRTRSRKRRAEIFLAMLQPQPGDTLLDLGGADGSYINGIVPKNMKIVIADYDKRALEKASRLYGYSTIHLDGSNKLEFSDGEFDIVFCSSVIEHVTGPKEEIIKITDDGLFNTIAEQHQRQFANEIKRIGKKYFVQTPNVGFIMETHSWLPGIITLLPRIHLIRTLKFFSLFWPKSTEPDWRLLNRRQVKDLFSEAEIVEEKMMGVTKSIIAVRR